MPRRSWASFRLPRALGLICLAGLLGVGGCQGRGARTDSTSRSAAQSPTAALIRAAGSDAALVLVLRTQRLAQSAPDRAVLASILAGKTLPRELRAPILAMLEGQDPLAALGQAVAALVPAQDLRWPARFEGLDDTRPLVAALFAPTIHGMGAVGAALFPESEGTSPALLRHRLLLPARDAAALSHELRTRFAEMGLRPLDGTGLSHGAFFAPGWVLGIFPAADHVRIELVTCERDAALWLDRGPQPEEIPEWLRKPGAPPPPLPSRSAQPPRTRPEAMSKAMLAVLLRPVAESAAPRTPALHQILAGDDLLAVHLRFSHLRALAMTLGAGYASLGVLGVDPSMIWTLVAKAWAETASAYMLTSPQGAQAEDAAFVLSSDLRMGAILSLTPAGTEAWSAARAAGLAPPRSVPSQPSILQLYASAGLPALFERTPLPPALNGLKPRDVAEAMHECGSICPLFAMLGAPLSWGQMLRKDSSLTRGLPVDLLEMLPGAVALSLTGLHRANPPLTAELTLSYPKGRSFGWLLGLLKSSLDREELRSEIRSSKDAELVSFAVKATPGQLLSPETQPLPPGVLAEAAVDLNLLRAAEGLSSSERTSLQSRTESLSGLRGRVSLSGRALVMELALDRTGVAPAPFRLPAPGTPTSWNSPWATSEDSAAQRCLFQAIVILRSALDGVAGVDPSMKVTLITHGLEEARPLLTCAAQDPAAAKEAALVRQTAERVLRGVREAPND